MLATAQGCASGAMPNTGTVDSTSRSIQVALDRQNMYLIRSSSSEWHRFSGGLLGSPQPFPALPMTNDVAVAANVLGIDATYLHPGERLQVLTSLILLASQIPDAAFLSGTAFPAPSAQLLFCDNIYFDSHRNRVYVLDLATTMTIQGNPATLATMVRVGYLFTLEIVDDHGNTTQLLYRPFNTGFASSNQWPGPLQILRTHIENRRNR